MFVTILILFSSCMTARRIERNCDLFSKVCGSGTTTEIKYRDTTIYVERLVPVLLPQDTAKATGQIVITAGGAQMPPVVVKKGIVTVRAEVRDSKLIAYAYINRDSLVMTIRDSILLKNAISQSASKTTLAPIRVKYIPVFYKITFWMMIAEIIGLILWLIIRLKSFKLF
jgi:hypothetical protein